MTPTQRELKEAHGTPEEFEEAVWRAQADGYVTAAEAVAGITRYKHQWLEAGRVGVHTFP